MSKLTPGGFHLPPCQVHLLMTQPLIRGRTSWASFPGGFSRAELGEEGWGSKQLCLSATLLSQQTPRARRCATGVAGHLTGEASGRPQGRQSLVTENNRQGPPATATRRRGLASRVQQYPSHSSPSPERSIVCVGRDNAEPLS